MTLKPAYQRFAIFLVLYEIAVYLSVDAFLPALPQIAQTFTHINWPISYTVSGWFLGTTVMQPFMGPLTEQLGYRKALLAGVTIFILASTVCVITHDLRWFLFARVLQGCCVATVHAPGYGIIHNIFDTKQAIRTTAWMGAITILAPSVGPMLGALILQWGDWRWIFIMIVIATVIAGVGLYCDTPTLPTNDRDHATSFMSRLKQYGRILTAPGYMRYKIGDSCLFACMIAWISSSPMLLMTHFHFDAVGYAWTQAVVFGAFIIGTRGVKHLTHHWQPLSFLRYTMGIAAFASSLGLWLSMRHPQWPWVLVCSVAGVAFSIGLSSSSLGRISIECSEEPMAMRVALGAFIFSGFGFLGSLSGNLPHDGQIKILATVICALTLIANIAVFCRPAPQSLRKAL